MRNAGIYETPNGFMANAKRGWLYSASVYQLLAETVPAGLNSLPEPVKNRLNIS